LTWSLGKLNRRRTDKELAKNLLLAIDVGNSHTVFGVWNHNRLVATARFSTHEKNTSYEWFSVVLPWLRYNNIEEKDILYAVFASVVPGLSPVIRQMLDMMKISGIHEITWESPLPFTFDYEDKKNLGADRIANAAGGIQYYGDSMIIADFGTAITFCLILERRYTGGLITPGIMTATDSLFKRTAKLPAITFAKKDHILGKNTVDSIEKGVYFGFRGLVGEIVHSLKNHARSLGFKDIQAIATGGISDSLGFEHDFFDIIDVNLTLKGAKAVYEIISER